MRQGQQQSSMAKQSERGQENIVEQLKDLALPIDNLHADPANARKHNDKNVDSIKASLAKFGQRKPIVVQREGMIVRAGNATLAAAKALGWKHIAAVVLDDDNATASQFAIADNRTAELAEWDNETLATLLDGMVEQDRDLLGFDADDMQKLLSELTPEVVEDEVPEPPADPITKPGNLWVLGDHRLLCGDSTKAEDVERLMAGAKAALIHADPPYGMGKEKDGVSNDNLYADKLDAFQMAWWKAARLHVADNGSAYIWGNAEDLWRLWYRGGLKDSERLTFRNEIVWDKKSAGAGGISHQGAEGLRLFPQATERCLFFMLGEQGFNNNADNYWEGWEPIRAYLADELKKTKWTRSDVDRITGTKNNHQHWFTSSQWALITPEQYAKLQAAANGDAFKREHDELKREHDELKREFYATRAYFDNAHDNMTDVWEFPRVTGEDRHGHATPKPVAMIQRCIKSSTPPNEIVIEPFLGSGTTLIAAEQLGRKCYGMEISPAYCDVIVKRWETLTGKKAVLAHG